MVEEKKIGFSNLVGGDGTLEIIKQEIFLPSRSWGFPGGSAVKNPPSSAGDMGSIPRSERSPGEGNGNPLQYSCGGNPMDSGAWQALVHGVSKSWTRLSN